MTALRRRVIAAVMVGLIATPTSAHAADEIGLSRDGASWAPTLPGPLFDSSHIWVPGDAETATFHVRNLGPTGATLTVEARSDDTDELLSNDDIALQVRVDDAQWLDLENGVPSEPIGAQAIGKGDSVQIDVNARFNPASPNRSQEKSLPLEFTVTLSQVAPSEGGSEGEPRGGGEESPRLLPTTGARITVGSLIAGILMLVVGAALARRREENSHD